MFSVIGAGPAGCIAAAACSKERDVVLYDPQNRVDRRIQCSGLISKSGLDRLGIPSKLALGGVRGARIYSPSGILLELDGGKDKAFVFDRRALDNYLLDEAIDAGAKYVNSSVKKSEAEKIISGSEKTILATGTNYSIHRTLGLDFPHEFLYGAQYEIKVECDPEYVEMYLNVPGFFSWIIPAGDLARVGLCTRTNPVPYLEKFVRKLEAEGRCSCGPVGERVYGIIPFYKPRLRTQYPGLILVGDAAGQVKASSGGGIVMGGIAAGYALSADYEKRWKKEIGRELFLHLLVRRFLDRLRDRSLDRLFLLLKENRAMIEKRGDMDRASFLLSGFAANPRFMAKFLLQAPWYLADAFLRS